MDLTRITLPQWFTSAIGLCVLAVAWRVVGTLVDELVRKYRPQHRRIGGRNSDDAHGAVIRDAWMDRLIEALNLNASVNKQVAESLTIMVSKQDIILESFRLTQLEQQECRERLAQVQSLLEERLPETA